MRKNAIFPKPTQFSLFQSYSLHFNRNVMNFHLFQDSRKRTNMTKTITRSIVIAARESLPISYDFKQPKRTLHTTSINQSEQRFIGLILNYVKYKNLIFSYFRLVFLTLINQGHKAPIKLCLLKYNYFLTYKLAINTNFQ